MPIPKPMTNENKAQFIARFMRETEKDSAFTRPQRLAIANEAWRKYLQERMRV